MTKPTYDADRVASLASDILRHKRLYYAGKPEIADADYDRLEAELRRLAPNHPALSVVGSPNLESSNPKVVHDQPMLSLNKTYSTDDLLAWVDKREVVGTLKVDGTSMSLVYRGGNFSLAKTRGNGREGEDVTAKLHWVPDAIPKLLVTEDCEIRGELYCSETSFVHLAEEMSRLGLEPPTSPRNIVAGILGRKLHGELARFFNFFAFDVIGIKGFQSETQKAKWLSQQGFRLPHVQLLKSQDEVRGYLDHIRTVMSEDEVGCDGAVFTYNEIAVQNELGHTSHHPRYKLSFKWQGETARSKIRRIDWATSRFGVVTPVAVVEPVTLSGATITNITLHNAAHVRAYHLKVGDVIELVRSGEVIPKFLSVVEPVSGEAVLPAKCPSCSSLLVADDVRLRCPASRTCPAQHSGVILNWIHAVEIEDLSEKRLQAMMDLGLVGDVSDLYRLKVEDLLRLPATKEKMATKLFNNIQATRSLPLPRFLNGLGVEGAGLTTWEKIVDECSTLAAVRSLSAEQLSAIPGFAEKSAHQITDGLAARSHLIDRLLAVGVKPTESTNTPSGPQTLNGYQIVITGALTRPRKEMEDLIKGAGGKIATSVSKNTSILITNESDSNSSKMQKAKQLRIPVWNEAQLYQKLEGE